MHEFLRVATFLTVAMATCGSRAAAQAIDDTVRPGMTVAVLDAWGDRYRGRVEHIAADRIRLWHLGDLVELSADAVVRIDQPQGQGKGMTIGLSSGIALGAAAGIATGGSPMPRVISVPILAGVGGLVGQGIGLLVDAVVHRPRTLYERSPRVIVGVSAVTVSRSKGVAVKVSW